MRFPRFDLLAKYRLAATLLFVGVCLDVADVWARIPDEISWVFRVLGLLLLLGLLTMEGLAIRRTRKEVLQFTEGANK